MSFNLAPGRAVGASTPAARRLNRRYPVQLALRYTILNGRRPVRQGFGQTQEISNTEVLFSSNQQVLAGMEVELSVDWPLRLNGICPLQLVILGRVIDCDSKRSTLKIGRYEFRTRGLYALPRGEGTAWLRQTRFRRPIRYISIQRG